MRLATPAPYAGEMEPVAPVADKAETAAPERRSVAEMLGETLREAGVLVGVFMPLDLALQGHGLTLDSGLTILLLPAGLLASGMILERLRTQ